jgi:hypothetical protein
MKDLIYTPVINPEICRHKITIRKGQQITDTFKGIKLVWEFVCTENQQTVVDNGSGSRSCRGCRRTHEAFDATVTGLLESKKKNYIKQ